MAIRGNEEFEAEKASWEYLTPEEAIGRSIYEVKEEAIKEIKAAKKETSILSYKMLITGAALGFLGSFLASAILNFWEYTTLGLCGGILLLVVGFIAFFGCIFFVRSVLKQMEGADK